MTREELIKEIARWIDTTVIAEAIVDAIDDVDVVPTLGDAQCVWLDQLQYLPEELKRSAAYILK